MDESIRDEAKKYKACLVDCNKRRNVIVIPMI